MNNNKSFDTNFNLPEGTEECNHCNGYGSSLKDPIDVDKCTKCKGSGLILIKTYVIYSKKEDGYWSNEHGWMDEVDKEIEDMIFTEKEKQTLNLPVEGQWEIYE